MLPTMIVGNLVFAVALWGYYMMVGGSREVFLPGLALGIVTYIGGIAVGIIASQPKKPKKADKAKKPVRSPASVPTPPEFEITD
jgi:hypothetical protein